MSYFAKRYFGPRYWGPHYFGTGQGGAVIIVPPPVEVQEGAGAHYYVRPPRKPVVGEFIIECIGLAIGGSYALAEGGSLAEAVGIAIGDSAALAEGASLALGYTLFDHTEELGKRYPAEVRDFHNDEIRLHINEDKAELLREVA